MCESVNSKPRTSGFAVRRGVTAGGWSWGWSSCRTCQGLMPSSSLTRTRCP